MAGAFAFESLNLSDRPESWILGMLNRMGRRGHESNAAAPESDAQGRKVTPNKLNTLSQCHRRNILLLCLYLLSETKDLHNSSQWRSFSGSQGGCGLLPELT